MKAFFSKILDFFYALKDWVIILLIFAGVIAVIAWRLDAMFTQKLNPADIPVISGVVKEEDPPKDSGSTSIDQSQPPSEDPESNELIEPEEPALVSLTIDEARDITQIGQQLQAAGMIEDGSAFGNRLVELERTDKLVPGHYEIPANYTLDEVINLLTL